MPNDNGFDMSQVYPATRGTAIADAAVLSPETNQLLGTNDVIKATSSKAANYNIISAVVAMVVLMILLQMSSK